MAEVDWKNIELREDELEESREIFKEFDQDGNGNVTVEELDALFKRLGEPVPGYRLREMIAEVDTDKSGTVDFDEFINMMKKARASGGKSASSMYKLTGKVKKLKKLGGNSKASSAETTHSFSEEEAIAFGDWINYSLGEDADLSKKLPLDVSTDAGVEKLFEIVKDGIVLAKLINSAEPGTIDERALNKSNLNSFRIGENQTLVVNSAAAIGVNITNIGPEDLSCGTPHIVLGLLWQIIRIGLFNKINIKECPGLSALLKDGEELKELLALSPEELLLRWVNFHLANAGCFRRINNFGSDIADSEAYTYLLTQIAPREYGFDLSPLDPTDHEERARRVLDEAAKLDCAKFVRPKDIAKGNRKLNLAFVANLFNTWPGLETADEIDPFAEGDIEETREEKTFRNWMNSLGVNPLVHHLYADLNSGLVLLQLIDKIKPGIVNWDKVNKPPFKKLFAQMKMIENCNYAVELGRQLGLSLVGIAGSDIYQGVQKLILGFAWQLMRAYTLKILQQLSGSDKPITDEQVLEFVNQRLSEGGYDTIRSFKDDSIATSRPILNLISTIRPNAFREDMVTAAETDEDKLANAKYTITIARKIGAGVYALPEDIVEVKPKMLLTIFACLQELCMRLQKQ
ncbi:L-plastin [Salpingoeca rosetta]|uniref:L-plastin n=1 Tax=Salpingoeca rosetta (strain ATCC 50818 / BSB-021) TaxID=946362 RepID=F2TWP3_SALR5|nr:L-plastin [Salpingoeca rosetta]EGD72489.1 L-plastin [Salpingoeca rosetta]|eukprot:XP_004999058.1 L-plastin [Salpingoeca rosetta]